MIKIFRLFAFSLLSALPIYSYATVGGPQNIEILGYEANEQKLYLLRHYEDGRGRLPQLYYYQFKNNKHPEKAIEVKSLYINPKTQKVDYDQDGTQFEKDLNKIKKRLTPLTIPNTKTTKIQIIRKTTQHVPSSYDPQEKMPQYTFLYKVLASHQSSSLQKAISYNQTLQISQNYIIPKQNIKIVVVKYLGIPFEMGYSIEDPVLLLPKR